MGQSFGFRCTRCRRKTQVGGGFEGGLGCATQTVYCLKCKTVQDIVVLKWPDFHPEEQTNVPPSPCRRCKAKDYAEWNMGDSCPNCGGNMKMKDNGDRILWD